MSDQTKIEQSHQVFIGQKDILWGVVALDIMPHGTIVGRTDYRDLPPVSHAPCQSPEKGKEVFEDSLKVSIEKGWKIVYCGKRNHG